MESGPGTIPEGCPRWAIPEGGPPREVESGPATIPEGCPRWAIPEGGPLREAESGLPRWDAESGRVDEMRPSVVGTCP